MKNKIDLRSISPDYIVEVYPGIGISGHFEKRLSVFLLELSFKDVFGTKSMNAKDYESFETVINKLSNNALIAEPYNPRIARKLVENDYIRVKIVDMNLNNLFYVQKKFYKKHKAYFIRKY